MAKRIIVTVLMVCLICGTAFAQKTKDFIAQGQRTHEDLKLKQ